MNDLGFAKGGVLVPSNECSDILTSKLRIVSPKSVCILSFVFTLMQVYQLVLYCYDVAVGFAKYYDMKTIKSTLSRFSCIVHLCIISKPLLILRLITVMVEFKGSVSRFGACASFSQLYPFKKNPLTVRLDTSVITYYN